MAKSPQITRSTFILHDVIDSRAGLQITSGLDSTGAYKDCRSIDDDDTVWCPMARSDSDAKREVYLPGDLNRFACLLIFYNFVYIFKWK